LYLVLLFLLIFQVINLLPEILKFFFIFFKDLRPVEMAGMSFSTSANGILRWQVYIFI